MDKNEYRAKLEEINNLVDNQDYQGALKIVDTIDWRRVRSARTLCMIGEIYEANKRYEDSRKLLLLAHQRAPIGKTVLYRLVELSIKMGNYNEAADYYKSFVEISPNDNSRYILKYKLYRARRSPIEEQIQILQEYKEKEYTERWSYELARLYAKAGMKEECIETCDDLILWFSEGKYVTKAMELKMKFTSLTPQQQEKYENGSSKKITETAAKAAAAVAAASEAAANVVEKITPEEQEEIEKILNSVELKIPEQEPAAAKPEHFQDKVAQNLRDVLQGSTADEAEEIAVAIDPAVKTSPEEKGYVVKDLEPEDLSKTTGFKPFHIGEGMTMQVKAEAPKSKMFDSKDFVPGSLQTSSKEFELDLEALLAETANELAQAVAEETGNQEEITEESAKEVAEESVEEVIEEAVEEPVEEIIEEAKEEPEESRAPEIAAAAVSLSAALAAKADEFDALAAGMTQEVVIKRDLEEPEVEEVQEEPMEVIPESEEEIIEEAIETMETVETEVEEGATKEFPVEKVKEALGEIDLSKALEEELEDTISPK
ncbi:MAG: tetratricopeptide repeat protein, partial [Blautia sp.]|nr:tetratricopeptide repeat protein [Blautia sp.]